MCTVSWRAARGGYHLFFNRDELNRRAPEHPPQPDASHGVAMLAPRDGDHGGTWLAVNALGLTVCLLNDYSGPGRTGAGGPRFSRGQVVREAAGAATLTAIVRRLTARRLTAVAPFRLLALAPDEEPLLLHWTGVKLVRRRKPIRPRLLTSSSFATAAVTAARFATFHRLVRVPATPAVRELARFHRQHDPAEGAGSVAMRREDAATRSYSHIEVNRRLVKFSYEAACWPRLPGGPTGRVLTLSLPRTHRHAG
jgi:hypothetical protein